MTNTEAKVREVQRYSIVDDGEYWCADTPLIDHMIDAGVDFVDVVLASDHDAAIAALTREVEQLRSLLDAAMSWVRSDTESPSAQTICNDYKSLSGKAP